MKPYRLWVGYVRVMIVVVIAFVCFGCASKEEKSASHLEKAREYIEEKEFNKAIIELKNVIQLDPKNDSAYYELGETYLKLKQGREAEGMWRRPRAFRLCDTDVQPTLSPSCAGAEPIRSRSAGPVWSARVRVRAPCRSPSSPAGGSGHRR